MPSLAELKVKLKIESGHSLTCLDRMESKHSDWRAVKLEVPQIVGVILQGVRQEWGTGGALLWEDAQWSEQDLSGRPAMSKLN